MKIFGLEFKFNGFDIWHKGNMGSGSGMDADTLDSKHASDFATAAQGTKADNALPASSYTASDVLAKIKTVDGAGSGLDADTLDGINITGFARAYSAGYSFGGSQVAITTVDFITLLSSLGAFNQPYWVARGSWSYAANKYISDTGIGNIHLAGSTVEVMGSSSAYTIRIHTPTTSSGVSNPALSTEFVYINNGSTYSPGWRKIWNDKNDGTGSGLDADLLDGKHASEFAVATDVVSKVGDTMTGKLTLPVSTTAEASINIPHGSAPTSPANGDMWTTTSAPYMRINGTTRIIIHSGIPTSLASDVSQAEAEAGTATSRRWWTAQRIAQAINVLQSVKSVNGQTGDINLSIPTKLSELLNDIGAGGGVKITTSTIAPSSPSPGDFWYKEI